MGMSTICRGNVLTVFVQSTLAYNSCIRGGRLGEQLTNILMKPVSRKLSSEHQTSYTYLGIDKLPLRPFIVRPVWMKNRGRTQCPSVFFGDQWSYSLAYDSMV